MPRRVINLYACWWTAVNTTSAAMWKMIRTFVPFVVSGEK
jgi:hypothetical protein